MASLAKAELDLLRAKIAAIEKRPVLAEGAAELAQRVASAGWNSPVRLSTEPGRGIRGERAA